MCSRCAEPAPARGQRGVALVVALLVFALSAALLVAMQRDFTLSYQRAANRLAAEQAWAYLRGAEELATLALQLDHDADLQREAPRDDLTELWAQEAAPYALDEGGWLLGSLIDLQGRFNLNSLAEQLAGGVGDAPRYTAAQQVFIRLLQSFEEIALTEYEAIAVTESIGDWIDADGEPRMNGAEAAAYSNRDPGYLPGNRPMADVSELRAVANMTPALYRALEPLVTVWPQTPAQINVHTAPPLLLRAFNGDGNLQPLSAMDGETLAALRAETGFANRDEFLAQEVFAGAAMDGAASLLGESSRFFRLDARVEIAGRQQRLYSILRREARQVDVLLRARGAL